jgi:hypothetical protein
MGVAMPVAVMNRNTDLIPNQFHRWRSLPKAPVEQYHFIKKEKKKSPYSSFNSPWLDLISSLNFYIIPMVLSYLGSALQRERVS